MLPKTLQNSIGELIVIHQDLYDLELNNPTIEALAAAWGISLQQWGINAFAAVNRFAFDLMHAYRRHGKNNEFETQHELNVSVNETKFLVTVNAWGSSVATK